MKNILKKFSIIFVLLVISISTISLAVDDVNYDDQVEPISMDEGTPVEVSDSEYTLSKNYFYAGSEDVHISNPVKGDVFVVTSGSVTIDTTITGNAFICATSVTIAESAAVQSSLFNVSNSLNILGNVNVNVYNVSKEFIFDGTIENDLFSTSNTSNINGYIYGDVNISSESISISDKSYIQNDLNYSSKEQISNLPENVVEGKINHSSIDDDKNIKSEIKDFVFSVISFVILAIIIFIIAKWLNCKFVNNYPDFVKNLPKSLLYGLLGLIVIPILIIILLICGVTISIAFISMAIYAILLLIASSIVIITLSKLAADKLHEKFDKINNLLLTILSIIVLGIPYKLLQLIPIFGTLITFLFVITGIGILIKNIIPTKEIENS